MGSSQGQWLSGKILLTESVIILLNMNILFEHAVYSRCQEDLGVFNDCWAVFSHNNYIMNALMHTNLKFPWCSSYVTVNRSGLAYCNFISENRSVERHKFFSYLNRLLVFNMIYVLLTLTFQGNVLYILQSLFSSLFNSLAEDFIWRL